MNIIIEKFCELFINYFWKFKLFFVIRNVFNINIKIKTKQKLQSIVIKIFVCNLGETKSPN